MGLVSKEEFIKRSILIHNDKYDYSKMVYSNLLVKIEIICPNHGSFWILPENHIRQKSGCQKCARENHKLTEISKERLVRIQSTHNNKYSYEDLKVVNGFINIICPEHGEFRQRIYAHEKGHGCSKCSKRIKSPPNIKTRQCKSCKNILSTEDFKSKFKVCKSCELNPIIPTNKCCINCGITKSINEFQPRKGQWDGYRNICIECYKVTTYLQKKIYRQKNKDILREKMKIYHKNRMESDMVYKAKVISRNLIRKSLSKGGYTKKSKTYQILGCTYEEFKNHIENQFKLGMNWENRDLWEIDHIVPISIAQSEDEMLMLNHHQNLRPLWKYENSEKSDNLTDEVIQSPIYKEILEGRELSIGFGLEEFIK